MNSKGIRFAYNSKMLDNIELVFGTRNILLALLPIERKLCPPPEFFKGKEFGNN